MAVQIVRLRKAFVADITLVYALRFHTTSNVGEKSALRREYFVAEITLSIEAVHVFAKVFLQ